MRYTDNGTIFYKRGEINDSWAIQINYVSGGGAPFKILKWATWTNDHMFLGLQETNEPIDMYGWTVATETDIVLYCKNQAIVNKLEDIKAAIRLGYKGHHATDDTKMAEITWRFGAG